MRRTRGPAGLAALALAAAALCTVQAAPAGAAPVAPVAFTSDTAATLDGASDGTISAAEPTAPPAAFSTELWFRTRTAHGGKLIGFGSARTGASASYDKHVYLTDDGHLVFGVWNGHPDTVTSPGTYNDGAWHHLVATQGADGMTLYVDGSAVADGAATTSPEYTGYWRIGGDSLDGRPQQPDSGYVAGDVDEAAVWSAELTAARVAAHYAAGTD